MTIKKCEVQSIIAPKIFSFTGRKFYQLESCEHSSNGSFYLVYYDLETGKRYSAYKQYDKDLFYQSPF
jgi:hypothetical protein